jgi:predicted metal-dependent phosphoesterase TrpH
MMIDLHVHTNMSDGTFSPEEVVGLALQKGLQAIAITDHDTVAGVRRAQAEGLKLGVDVIAGVEISTQWPQGILHILGYFIDPEQSALLDVLDTLRADRKNRVDEIVARLNDHSLAITAQEVNDEAVGGVPGRPHVASLLVRKGHVNTVQDAFDRFLGRGAPAYVPKKKLPPEQALQVIVRAGGLAVLAHPYSLYEPNVDRLEDMVRELMRQGLQGIEAHCPKHTPEQTAQFLALAEKLGLAVSGGTDFHGKVKPDIELGRLPSDKTLPCSILENLRDRHNRLAKARP